MSKRQLQRQIKARRVAEARPGVMATAWPTLLGVLIGALTTALVSTWTVSQQINAQADQAKINFLEDHRRAVYADFLSADSRAQQYESKLTGMWGTASLGEALRLLRGTERELRPLDRISSQILLVGTPRLGVDARQVASWHGDAIREAASIAVFLAAKRRLNHGRPVNIPRLGIHDRASLREERRGTWRRLRILGGLLSDARQRFLKDARSDLGL
jgi:hypothetical protein